MKSTPRGLIWVFGIAAVVLQAYAVFVMGKDAAGILMIGIPSMFGVIGGDVFANRITIVANTSTTAIK